MKLYEIDDRLQQALDAVYMDEETGELHGMEAVELLQLELNSKLLDIGKYCKALEAESVGLEVEMMRLDRRNKTVLKKYARLAEIINQHVEYDKPLKDSQCTLTKRKCAPSVNIIDQKLIPTDYTRMKVTNTPDKELIKQALKDGVVIPGAELITNYSLQIK